MAQETLGMLRAPKKPEEPKKTPTLTRPPINQKKPSAPKRPVATSDTGITQPWLPELRAQQPTQTFQPMPQVPQYDPAMMYAQQQSYLQQQIEAQKRAQMQALQGQLRTSQAALAEEQAQLGPAYQQARTDVDVQAQQRARRLAELLGTAGAAEGAQATQLTQQSAATQQAITGLTQQEQAAMDQIARERANLQQAYAGNVAQMEAALEAQRTGSLLDLAQQQQATALQQQQQQFANQMSVRQLQLQQMGYTADQAAQQAQLEMQQAGLTGMYQGQQTLAAQQAAQDQLYRQQQLEMQQAGLTGMYQGQPTLPYLQATQPTATTDYATIYNRVQDLARTSPELAQSYLQQTGLAPEVQQQIMGALPAPTVQADVTPYTSFIEDQFMFKDVMGQPQVNTQGASQYINNLVLQGAIPPESANQLRTQYNLPSIEQVIADVQRRNEANEITDEEALQELTAYGIQF